MLQPHRQVLLCVSVALMIGPNFHLSVTHFPTNTHIHPFHKQLCYQPISRVSLLSPLVQSASHPPSTSFTCTSLASNPSLYTNLATNNAITNNLVQLYHEKPSYPRILRLCLSYPPVQPKTHPYPPVLPKTSLSTNPPIYLPKIKHSLPTNSASKPTSIHQSH